jgi:hypothetical protein
MQVDEFVAEGPIRNALYVGLPVDCRASQWRSRELGKRVQVFVVNGSIYSVGDEGCQCSWQQDAHGTVFESRHCI